MKRFEEDFQSKLVGIDWHTIESCPDSVFGLDTNLNLTYFNPGWMKFALDNNAEPQLSSRFPIGTSWLEAISGDLKKYYHEQYNRVLQTGEVWHHEYECSSTTEFRLFRQSVYPLKQSDGLLTVNRLRKSLEISMTKKNFLPHKADENDYRQPIGFINQCSNCRCVQRVSDPKLWDWVSEWVEKNPPLTSHTVCSVCYDYYWKYGEINLPPLEE